MGLSIFLVLEVAYVSTTKSMNKEMLEKKIDFVRLTTLPDLALSSESHYVRHRSVSDFFSIYKEDGSLREYARATFAISTCQQR